jgi:hypothetical protein
MKGAFPLEVKQQNHLKHTICDGVGVNVICAGAASIVTEVAIQPLASVTV